MISKRPDIMVLGVAILGISVIIGLTWANHRFTSQNPGGDDFAPRWLGTRLWITEGQSPYGNETTQAIQDFIYGRSAHRGEDPRQFLYPHFSMFVFSPFALAGDYSLARALWMTTLEVALILLAGLSLSITGWRPPTFVLALLFFFSLTWYHALRPLIDGNPAVLVALFMTLALLFIQRGRDQAAGYMLALGSIKPPLVVLLIPFVCLWALSRRRGRVVWGLFLGLIFLVAASWFVQRDWVVQMLRQWVDYLDYVGPDTPGENFSVWWPQVGSQLGWALTGLLAAFLVVEWIVAWGKDFRWFLWTACLTLVITNLIGIPTATANYLAMFPALVLLFSVWSGRWGRGGQGFAFAALFTLLIGLWALFIATVTTGVGDRPVSAPVMFFPLPVFLLLGLYWVRYWAVKPRHLPIEDIRSLSKI